MQISPPQRGPSPVRNRGYVFSSPPRLLERSDRKVQSIPISQKEKLRVPLASDSWVAPLVNPEGRGKELWEGRPVGFGPREPWSVTVGGQSNNYPGLAN